MSQPVAVITGAGSGIGLHLAKTLWKMKFRLCLIDIELSATRKAMEESDRVMFRVMDVRDTGAWREAVNHVIQTFGRIDYLMNLAAVIQPSFIYDAPLDDIDKHMDINAKGSMYGTRIVGEVMKQQRDGHIINIASLAGIAPIPGIALYSASKFALRGFSLAAAYEYAPLGVTVSVVCPDLVKTPMFDLQLKYAGETDLVFSGNRTVLLPEDITKEILKLMKSRKREVTIPPSRGRLAKLAGLWPGLADLVRGKLTRKGSRQKLQFRKEQ